MIKKIFVTALFCLSTATFACGQAVPTTAANFCSSFQSVAMCHCNEKTSPPLRPIVCANMGSLYTAMMARFHNLTAACQYQKDTTTQECIDDWNCYRNGGVNSQGAACSGNRKAC